MLEYLIKVSFIIAVAFLFYKVFLQQESFFGTNRIYFVLCIVLAFLTPFVKLPALVSHQGLISVTFSTSEPEVTKKEVYNPSSEEGFNHGNKSTLLYEQVPERATEILTPANDTTSTSSFNYSWTSLLSIFYIFGAGIFSLNFLFQILYIFYKVKKSNDVIHDGEYIIVNTPNKQAPCSFFNYIFIYPDDYDFETYEQIILHEKIHVKQGHSWDLILTDLAVIVLWFNPFIWMYKKENHHNSLF